MWKEIAVARLSNLSAVAIEIEVTCWFETADYERFRAARQEVLLGIVTVVENAGARLGPPPATAPAPAAPASVGPQGPDRIGAPGAQSRHQGGEQARAEQRAPPPSPG